MNATKPALAYTIEEAAVACGVSVRTLNRAIARGDITRKYPTSYPVIMADELHAWLESLPVDKPVAS
jgi:hypothetical protein